MTALNARDFIDLHSHSTSSDGVLSPSELVRKAHENGVGLLSLTDHDTMQGVTEAGKIAGELGVRLIPGIEISTTTHGRGCHLLAYFENVEIVRSFAGYMQARLEARQRRFDEMARKFHKIGVELDAARVRSLANGGAITRPHVARVLQEQGIVKDYQEAFDRFMAAGKPCYVPYEKLPTAGAIEEVHKYGGIASVAHPGLEKFTPQEIADLRQAGLDAIEVYHFDHDGPMRRRYRAIAEDLKLLATGGSDYHGNNGRHFYKESGETAGVPQGVRGPFLDALAKAAVNAQA